MKPTTVIKTLLTRACVYYSAAALLLLLLSLSLEKNASAGIGAISFLLLFPFALSLSWAHGICTDSKLPKGACLVLHYLISLAAFLLFLWLPSRATKTVTSTLIVLLLLSVLYWFCYLVGKLTVARFQSYREE